MNIYSDQALKTELTSNLRGIVRRAEILLTIPETMRAEVVAESHRIMNNIGGRPTEALLAAVRYAKAGA
tara:strand:+ start:1462 stop:1668 length:207 start_codon:yes stop_codon:yes gene_type:complete